MAALTGSGLEPDEQQRMVQAAVNQGLIIWNENKRRHELTRDAHKWLINYAAVRKVRGNFEA
jgi:hypothetical protein